MLANISPSCLWLIRLHQPVTLFGQTPSKPTIYSQWLPCMSPHNAISLRQFLTKRPNITMSGHGIPPLQPSTIYNEFRLILLFFIKDFLVCCTVLPPYSSYRKCIICCSNSTYTIGYRTHPYNPCECTTVSTTATFLSPWNAPISCTCLNWTKLRAWWLKKGNLIKTCLYFNCGGTC